MNKLFEMLDVSDHVVQPVRLEEDAHEFLVIESGYVNPFIAQWWSLNIKYNDLCLYREICMTNRKVEDNIIDVLKHSKDDKFFGIVINLKNGDKGTEMLRHILSGKDTLFTQADRSIKRGLYTIENALADGKLHFFKDALLEKDRFLEAHGRPTNTVESLERTTYAENEKGIQFGNLSNGVWATVYAVNFCFRSTIAEKQLQKQKKSDLIIPPEVTDVTDTPNPTSDNPE